MKRLTAGPSGCRWLVRWVLAWLLLARAGGAAVDVAGVGTERVPLIVPGTEFVTLPSGPPERAGFNDFCVFHDDKRLWHLFAITTYRSGDPKFPHSPLLHATADGLAGPWQRQPYVNFGPAHNWAPYIVRDPRHPSVCVMFLGGTPDETLRVYESDARDPAGWKLRADLGQSYGTRDPMVRFDAAGQRYYLYATKTSAGRNNEGIAVSVSSDLAEWKTVHVIPTGPKNTCDESPFVVEKDGWYYLWATASSIHYYYGIPTRVFRSAHADFRDLPNTRPEHAIYELPLHAVEIVEDAGRTWIGQTGHGGPGIVFHRLRWGAEGVLKRVGHESLVYHGDWSGTQRRGSARPGDAFECRFEGMRVEWRGNRSASAGRAEVFLDGKSQGTVDQYASAGRWDTAEYPGTFFWTSNDLRPGRHALRVVVRGEKDPASRGTLITVGHVLVWQTALEGAKGTGTLLGPSRADP
jgi:hypothetical protein